MNKPVEPTRAPAHLDSPQLSDLVEQLRVDQDARAEAEQEAHAAYRRNVTLAGTSGAASLPPDELEELRRQTKPPEPYRHDEWQPAGDHFKQVPESKELRERLRSLARTEALKLPRNRPPAKQTLFELASRLLETENLGSGYTGFAMVLLNNEYWRDEFAAVPFDKRLFSMPHCLKQAEKCTAKIDDVQLHCNGCGLCELADFDTIGRRLGYNVLIAEGTPIVLKLIASGAVEGILGVACLNVLEKSFDRVLQLGMPALAIPLLRDTCHNTEVDGDWVMQLLGLQKSSAARTRSFVPLLRSVVHDFDPAPAKILVPHERPGTAKDPLASTERLALAWMRKGGKRFRPFLTQAAWQAITEVDEVPLAVKKISAAMECIHKASLIHDDIEDDDDFRYGAETLHRSHSVPVALNLGDYLLGRGYRVVADLLPEIGAEKAALILAKIAQAHVKLAEGQGFELTWRAGQDKTLQPLDTLKIYALKTAPAFDVALYAGLALADFAGRHDEAITRFAKHLGVAYQIQNDLKDMEDQPDNKVVACGDILKGSPTLLFALALETATAEERARLLDAAAGDARERSEAEGQRLVEALKQLYYRYEIPLQAALLADRQKQKALEAVANVNHDGLQALFTFLTATLLE